MDFTGHIFQGEANGSEVDTVFNHRRVLASPSRDGASGARKEQPAVKIVALSHAFSQVMGQLSGNWKREGMLALDRWQGIQFVSTLSQTFAVSLSTKSKRGWAPSKKIRYREWTKSCATLKPCKPTVSWYLQGYHQTPRSLNGGANWIVQL